MLKLQIGVAFGATPVCCSFCNCLQAVSTLKESIVAFALSLVLEFRDPLFAVLGCDLAFFYSMVLTPAYESIEADFQKDEQRWEENLKREQSKPSGFEGGSMAPADHNMRMTAFVEKRIKELKQKWIKK